MCYSLKVSAENTSFSTANAVTSLQLQLGKEKLLCTAEIIGKTSTSYWYNCTINNLNVFNNLNKFFWVCLLLNKTIWKYFDEWKTLHIDNLFLVYLYPCYLCTFLLLSRIKMYAKCNVMLESTINWQTGEAVCLFIELLNVMFHTFR